MLKIIFFTYSAFNFSKIEEDMLYVLLVCIFSDIGGYVIGKSIGGKKLTKLSPNKTLSGTLGSFVFSLAPFMSEDIITIVGYIYGEMEIDESNVCVGDADQNEEINILDITTIVYQITSG